jgi:hypothetical protein
MLEAFSYQTLKFFPDPDSPDIYRDWDMLNFNIQIYEKEN